MRSRLPVFVLFLAFFLPLGSRSAPPQIHWNDNERPAGHQEDGQLQLDLEVRRGEWHPLGEEEPGLMKLAFAESGEDPRVPGPLIRIPKGTEVTVDMTNPLEVPLEIQGLASRHDPNLDRGRLPPGADLPWVRIPAGETKTFAFTADARGTYFYHARVPADSTRDTEGIDDGLLAGALVVDAPGEGPREHEKVMLIQGSNGYLTINGRPWPLTERLIYDIGDEVTYRVINNTGISHPMHLHGFFFTLQSRGDIAQDTLYGPTRRQKEVTQTVRPNGTLKINWSPTRPGGWIYHCHISYDFMPNPEVSEDPPEFVDRIIRNARTATSGMAHERPEKGMGGMVMGIYVRPPEGYTPEKPEGKPIRLHVRKDSTAGNALPRFGFALGEPGKAPPAGKVPFPGPPLVLHEGAPAAVRVVNETDEPTTVHWHGLEVESLYDGVAGVTGYREYRTPAVFPKDGFDAVLRTDRPGTYMYHTHMGDIRQQGAGLYGPLIILPEGEKWDPTTDRIYLLGNGFGKLDELATTFFLNGSTDPESEQMRVGTTYRLRLLNIALGGEVVFRLVRDGYPVRWRPLAQDAWDLPVHQRDRTLARQKVNVGETFDFSFTPESPGELTLEVRETEGELAAEIPIRVTKTEEDQ